MFERFSDGARRAIVRSQEHARLLGHSYIGTEHLLLGVLDDTRDLVAQTLESLDISPADVRAQVEAMVGRGSGSPAGHIPFTAGAKEGMELALAEAEEIESSTVRAEHVLLALIRQGEGVAGRVLVDAGADLPRARAAVVALRRGHATGEEPAG